MGTVHLIPPPPEEPPRDDRWLAALIVILDAGRDIARNLVYAAVIALAAIGLVSLIGR